MGIQLRIFEYFDAMQDQTFEWSGWHMVGMEHFEPAAAAMVVVHDCIEHFQKNESGLDREFMAFGSIIHIRARGGWWDNTIHAAHPLTILQKELLVFMIKERFNFPDCSESLDYELEQKMFSRKEFEDYVRDEIEWDGESYEEFREEWHYDKFVMGMRWVSKGIRAAEKRWGNHDSYELCQFFHNMETTIESANKYDREHGTRLEIRFDTKALKYSMRVRSPYEGWRQI